MPIITPQQTDGADLDSDLDNLRPEINSALSAQPSTDASEPLQTTTAPQRSPGALNTEPAPALGIAKSPWWRSRKLIAGVAALAAVGAAVAVGSTLIGGDNNDSNDAANAGQTITAVEATTGDLAEFVTVDGVLAYGDPVVYTAAVDGTITQAVEPDDVLDRGDIAYAVNESPVVVFWGDSPLYRPLVDGVDDGADVQVVEANLLALGYDAEGELVVDEVFDDATTAAIEAFQEDMGMTVDGVLNPASVLLLNGPAVVSDVAAPLGTVVRATNPVLALQLTDEVTTVVLHSEDALGAAIEDVLITDIPRIGESFSAGDMVYERDTRPVIAIVGDVEFDRVLSVGVEDGTDIELLEQTLLAHGFDADGELEVDEHFDTATEEALSAWEESLDMDDDGVLDPSDYVVLPPDHTVIDVPIERGDRLDGGDVVFTAGVTTQTLVATIDADDVGLIAVGDTVDVDFADTTVSGTVIDIGEPVASPADPETETVEFEIALSGPAPARDSLSTDVEVQIAEQIATDVTLVPASALISLGDGTYAVEEVRGDTTAFVAVEPGEFSDGMVAVDGIEPGTLVVVPS